MDTNQLNSSSIKYYDLLKKIEFTNLFEFTLVVFLLISINKVILAGICL